MHIISRKDHGLNGQTIRVVHGAKGQRHRIGDMRVGLKDGAAACAAKGLCDLRPFGRGVLESAYIPTDRDKGHFKHRVHSMACSTKAAAFFAMTLRHDTGLAIGDVGNLTAKALSSVF